MYVCGHPVFAGVGIGVVDVGNERRLANHLGAHRTPSILGVLNGKVTFFHYAVAKEHLRQFVEDLLPQRLVEWVSDSICVWSILQGGQLKYCFICKMPVNRLVIYIR